MADAPIMMPMQPDAAAQQMLIEQVRRLSDSVDRGGERDLCPFLRIEGTMFQERRRRL